MKKNAKKTTLPLEGINTTDINKMVADYANIKFGGTINLAQYKERKQKALTHQNVCIAVERFREEHPEMPLYAVLSVGIAQGAYKKSAFADGYKKFDKERCETVLKMAKAYNEKLGIKGKPSDVTYRLMLKFYNNVSTSVIELENRLENAQNLDGKRGHFKEMCAALGM